MNHLIVGAGPVGLAGALFLKRGGRDVRIFDKLVSAAPNSRALAVNPRTLEILRPTGITEKMLALGLKIPGAILWRENGSILGQMNFEGIHARYPHMLALSQAVTERLLNEALTSLGTSVERGKEILSCQAKEEGVELTFTDKTSVSGKNIFAADGAHSVIRNQLKIDFAGDTFGKPWYLVDVALETDLAPNLAHVIFLDDGGFYFVLRVVEDIEKERSLAFPIWRVISPFPDPLKNFSRGVAQGEPIWASNFHVSHRVAEHLQAKKIFLAGDAAHIHSPMGARGMNLGIEDAWTFAELVLKGHEDQYGKIRKETDQAVVNKIRVMSEMAMGESKITRFARSNIAPIAMRIGPARRLFARTLSGLDHTLL